MKTIALVIGGYVNGYSMIQELHAMGVSDIGLLHYKKCQPAKHSNMLHLKVEIEKDERSLLSAIEAIHIVYDKIVIYPSDEYQIAQLVGLYEKISEYCFLPFNPKNILASFDKEYQYRICERIGVPVPQTITLKKDTETKELSGLLFPIVIKPKKRYDIKGLFRIRRLESQQALERLFTTELTDLLDQGCEFLVSEMIPGDTNTGLIYAYTCYRSPSSKMILNEWIGRKESQWPDNYGVFSTASSQLNPTILDLGRRLTSELDAYGIIEPEFKYDERDGQFKLMEVNFRSMMWHRVGHLSGVRLQYTQWKDALGKEYSKDLQGTDEVWYSYLVHEIFNLIARPGYAKYFKRNIFRKNVHLALWNAKDPMPFLIDCLKLFKFIPKAVLERLRNAKNTAK